MFRYLRVNVLERAACGPLTSNIPHVAVEIGDTPLDGFRDLLPVHRKQPVHSKGQATGWAFSSAAGRSVLFKKLQHPVLSIDPLEELIEARTYGGFRSWKTGVACL